MAESIIFQELLKSYVLSISNIFEIFILFKPCPLLYSLLSFIGSLPLIDVLPKIAFEAAFWETLP